MKALIYGMSPAFLTRRNRSIVNVVAWVIAITNADVAIDHDIGSVCETDVGHIAIAHREVRYCCFCHFDVPLH